MSSQNQLAVAKTKDWLKSDDLKDQIAQALPKHLTPDRFLRILFTSMQKTPKLMQCTQASLFSSLIDCSQLGIEPDGRRAHLIPYKRGNTLECQLIIDYKGLVELVMRSGLVSNVHADTVCEEDIFEYNLGQVDKHTIDLKRPRGEIYAAYCIATFKDGTKQSAVMSKEEIDAIRKRSKAGNSGPWVSDYPEMSKKTVFRRLSKWLPISPEQRELIEKDDNQFDFNKMAQAEDPRPFDGFGNAPTAATSEPEDAEDIRLLIDEDRVQFIRDRLNDENKDEKWFMSLVLAAYPETPAKSIEQLTQEESSAAISAWEAA